MVLPSSWRSDHGAAEWAGARLIQIKAQGGQMPPNLGGLNRAPAPAILAAWCIFPESEPLGAKRSDGRHAMANGTGRLKSGCRDCPSLARGLCSALQEDELSRLNSATWQRRYQPGQVIHAEGEVPPSFCAIMSGTVKLLKSLPNGSQQIVGSLERVTSSGARSAARRALPPLPRARSACAGFHAPRSNGSRPSQQA